MADWRAEVRRRLERLRLSERRIDEIADELADHAEERYRALRAAGAPHEDAEATVWREFETPDRLARRIDAAEHPPLTDFPASASRGQRAMGRLKNDFRNGLRSLRKIRGSTAMAVVAFALGIGITTAVFSVFYGVLLKPLPYPDADRMVRVFDVQPSCATCPASYTKYDDWRTRSNDFEAMTGLSNVPGIVTGMGDSEQILVTRTTWTMPGVFKVQPMTGRWFTEDEDRPGGDRVALLGYQYWIERFGGDHNVLGRGLTIDGLDYRVIGVMPKDFQPTVQVFRPLQMAPNPGLRGNHFLPVYARLKASTTVAQAQRDMKELGVTLQKEFGHNHGIDVMSYPELVLKDIRPRLKMLMAAVVLVLLIACANIANLLLATGTARQREFALRAAIGATRWDLSRQLLVESVALSVVGGLFGLVLAVGAVRMFVVMADQIVPRAATVSIDGVVLLFAFGLSLVTGVFCGLWPVMRLDVHRLASSVREGDVRGGTDATSRRFGQALVVAEIALAFSLLAGAGLLVKDLILLESRDLGFKTDQLIAFDVGLVGPKFTGQNAADAIRAFDKELFDRFRTIPGVESVAGTRNLPIYNSGWNGEVTLQGGNPWAPKDAPLVEMVPITPEYFATFRMPVRQGRAFDERDRINSEPVTILTKGTAERFWPGQNPIGKRMTTGNGTGPNVIWTTVVGIVDDVRSFGLQSKAPLQMYFPAEQTPFTQLTVVMRVAGDDPSAPIPAARRIVHDLDPSLAVSKVQTLESLVVKSVGTPRLLSMLTSIFGGLAGVLAAVGVYGVMAYNVRRDRRQFGIRLALGADPARVRRLILMNGLTLGAIGIVIGAAGAWFLTRFVTSIVSDVKPDDPWVFAGTAVSLLIIAVAACAWPAFQAGRTDPMVTLRAD